MNEQEMQFADPDWKPTGPLSVDSEDAGADAPMARPVKSDAHTMRQSASELYEEGYRGPWQEEPPPYTPLSARQMAGKSTGAAHWRSLWWVWLMITILLISLIGSMSHSFDRGSGFGRGPGFGGRGSFGPGFQQQGPVQSSFFYNLQGASQLTINGQAGSIIIQATDRNTNGVTVQTDNGSQPDVRYAGNSMTLTSSNGGDVEVIIPQNVALHLATSGSGVIEVDGFTGQLAAQTDSGSITLNGDALNGQSTISSNSANITLYQDSLSGQTTISAGGNGNIGFAGALDPQGTYRFTTDHGDIELILPTTASIQVEDSPGRGSFHNDFPRVAGNSAQASVTVKTNSGEISIHPPQP